MSIKDFIDETMSAVDQTTTLNELITLIKSHGIKDCPVINSNDEILGIIYQRDLLAMLCKDQSLIDLTDEDFIKIAAGYSDKTVSDIMTAEFIAAGENDSLVDVSAKMIEAGLSSLPVVKDDKFIGMISQAKVFSEVMEKAAQLPQENEQTSAGNENTCEGLDIDDALAAAKQAVASETEEPAAEAPKVPATPKQELSGPNKRFFRRVDMKIPVAYKPTNLGVEAEGKLAETVNVSAGGMMIAIKDPLPENTMLEVALDIYQNDQPLKSTCRVVRCMPGNEPGTYNAGLIFLAISVEERKKIINYLDETAPE